MYLQKQNQKRYIKNSYSKLKKYKISSQHFANYQNYYTKKQCCKSVKQIDL